MEENDAGFEIVLPDEDLVRHGEAELKPKLVFEDTNLGGGEQAEVWAWEEIGGNKLTAQCDMVLVVHSTGVTKARSQRWRSSSSPACCRKKGRFKQFDITTTLAGSVHVIARAHVDGVPIRPSKRWGA